MVELRLDWAWEVEDVSSLGRVGDRAVILADGGDVVRGLALRHQLRPEAA